ncbi:MAG: PKD domain-containing protein [Aggregatilineales bacterium]
MGVWNTTAIQDSVYQLRLHVTLRDGTSLSTVANNIRIQNQAPTPVPTATTVPRPIGAFTQDRVVGQAPLVVRFFNQSTGNITSYSWDFGDGGSSPEVNPVHTFRNPGVYTVQLTVTGPGGSSNVSRQINVQSATPPVAAFTQDRTSGPSPLVVQFSDQSTGTVTSRTWNFGDGTISDEINPTHTFTAVGTYNVMLTVTGPSGSSSVTRQITVQNPTIPAPIAALAVSQSSGNAPLTVQFDASDSSGQIDSYNWDFGDGQFGAGPIVTHEFANPGEYRVRLLVVGPGGQSEAQTTITVVRLPDAPIASFTLNPTSGNVPLVVQFDASSSTGLIDSYSWDFGDSQSGTGLTPAHTYTAPGTYTVELIVTGPGGTSSTSAVVSATEPIAPPRAAFDFVPLGSTAPLEVQFINQTSGESLTFSWDFGDGQSSAERDPRHTFVAPGLYVVRLTAQGPGGTDSAERTIEVSSPPEVEASFTVNPPDGAAPLTVQLEAAQLPNLVAFDWNLGDGAVASGPSVSHTYATPGDFTITLTVTSADGRTASAEQTVFVTVPLPAPEASFTVNPPNGAAPLTVQLEAAQLPNLVAFDWNLGDGAVASGPSVSHTYATPGDFTITLTVTSADGRTASAEQTVSVTEQDSLPGTDIVLQTPVIPDLESFEVQVALRAIYERGEARGHRAAVFAKVGDDLAVQAGYLMPFADPGLSVTDADLVDILNWHNQLDVGDGRSSFDRQSVAARAGWRIQDVVDQAQANSAVCSPGETPLQCEVRLLQPGAALVSVGLNHVFDGDLSDFRAKLDSVIQSLLDEGVIPVVSTIQPVPSNPAGVDAVNTAILETAQAVALRNNTAVPIYNLWLRYTNLPGSGLGADGISPTVSPAGPGDLSPASVSAYGINARNHDVLIILDMLRSRVYPDAQP